jgi:hypothetical protein
MATFSMSRRTGALLAGVVPPSGVPLPQQSLGIGSWVGTPEELSAPSVRAELLRLAKMRREVRAGHLMTAARIALDVDVDSLPGDPATTRSVAVLRSVGATRSEAPGAQADEILRASLDLLGPTVPPALLDNLLDPGSRVEPSVVEQVCLRRDASPATVARLRVLLVRRAARDYRSSNSASDLDALHDRVREAQSTPMHESLLRWVTAVGNAAGRKDLTSLIDALGHNLPLTDLRNKELHEALGRCFEWPLLDKRAQQRLARLSFSAWSTLRDAGDGTGAAELVSFSAQAAAFRQVFEELLRCSVLRRFLRVGPVGVRHRLLDAVRRGDATIGIGRWYGLLFASNRFPDELSEAVRAWFHDDRALASLRENQRLRTGLGDLLQVRLHALPHDEESARASAADVLETVARVGFGSPNALALPLRGDGLIGQLCVLPP